MTTKDTQKSKRFTWIITCGLFLLAAVLWPGSAAATIVTATKTCVGTTCTVTEASFTIYFQQGINWTAKYAPGSPPEGHHFWISPAGSSHAQAELTNQVGDTEGTTVLLPASGKAYHISINTPNMGPGVYTIEYNGALYADPHITTVDGSRYDFQGAGEFVALRNPRGLEIQVRQTPVATAGASCVSINSAVAARVGTRRVTYEPNLSGVPDPGGLQLRVDGVLTTLSPPGLDLGSGARITSTSAPGGIRVDFPDRSVMFVTPGWWASQNQWYLNVDLAPTQAGDGIAGVVPPGSWLPALPDGTSMGPQPGSAHDRYVDLNQKFADAWRVTDATSLFDYASGTSAATFTMKSWPPEQSPCTLAGAIPAQPATEAVAQSACAKVAGESTRANCVFDVMVTGNTGFATTYLLSQALRPEEPATQPHPPAAQPRPKGAVFLDFGAGIPHGTFSSVFNTGLSFNAGLELPINSQVSAEAIFGVHRFPAAFGGGVNLYQFSGNVKTYLTSPPNRFRPFVNGGVGAYKFGSGSTNFGGNVGAGVLYELTPRFGVQGSYNFHIVNTPGPAIRFSTLQGGVRFVF